MKTTVRQATILYAVFWLRVRAAAGSGARVTSGAPFVLGLATEMKASTTVGSNWLPAWWLSTASASV